VQSYRKYGKAPFEIAVIHGGPGAPGEMEPVARHLARQWGVLEPLQTADSLFGQVAELKSVIESEGDLPMVLIGFSWGAWLSVITASEYPSLIKRLILIGCPAFEQRYHRHTLRTRLERLSTHEKRELNKLLEQLEIAADDQKEQLFTRLGMLTEKADNYAPEEHDHHVLAYQYDIFQKIWPAAEKKRESGDLLKRVAKLSCPVRAIHGDHDPHPGANIKQTLSESLNNFRFFQLKKCGHKPWIERYARADFYRILEQEVRSSQGQNHDF